MKIKFPYDRKTVSVVDVPDNYRLYFGLFHERNPYLDNQVLFDGVKDFVNELLRKRKITPETLSYGVFEKMHTNACVEVRRKCLSSLLRDQRAITQWFHEIYPLVLARVSKRCPRHGECEKCHVVEDCVKRRFKEHFSKCHPTVTIVNVM